MKGLIRVCHLKIESVMVKDEQPHPEIFPPLLPMPSHGLSTVVKSAISPVRNARFIMLRLTKSAGDRYGVFTP
jgi:hypothetical protein